MGRVIDFRRACAVVFGSRAWAWADMIGSVRWVGRTGKRDMVCGCYVMCMLIRWRWVGCFVCAQVLCIV
jgi:hypothetical protein